MDDLPNSALSLSSSLVASLSLSSSSFFLESLRSLSSILIGCMLSPSSLKAAVSRPCHERDVLPVSAAEEAAFFLALLQERGSLFSCKHSVR